MKSVIITGANRGIGYDTALAFGRAGYKVFATMRNPEGATALKSKIQEESLPISMLKMDVNSDASVTQAMAQIQNEHGLVNVLVNNAGIERHGTIEDLDMSEFKAVMETNYFGVIRCVKAILPQMREKRTGCIINVASVAGHISCTPLAPYSASKFALEALSEALAQEAKPFNIHVKIIEPGVINTDMARDIGIEKNKNSTSNNAKRFAGLFNASLKNPTDASLVADKILEVAESSGWTLRHPVGPDAEPFLGWRESLNDEAWVDWHAANDEDWYNAVAHDFGLDAREEVVSSV